MNMYYALTIQFEVVEVGLCEDRMTALDKAWNLDLIEIYDREGLESVVKNATLALGA